MLVPEDLDLLGVRVSPHGIVCKIYTLALFWESPKIELLCKILHTKALFGGALPQPQCTPSSPR